MIETPLPKRHHLDRRATDLAQEGAAAGEADDLLNTSEVAEWLGVSVQFLEIGRHRGFGPKFIRLSPRRTRYLRADVLTWLAERTHQATAEFARRLSAEAGADVPEEAAPAPGDDVRDIASRRTEPDEGGEAA